jgi:hypothetical protein
MSKIFTPREADALIVKIEPVFLHMDQCRKRVLDLGGTLPVKSAQPSASDVAESARLRSQMEFLLQAVQDDIALIGRMGGVVKDVEEGLVDFPGRFDGQDVWLCWKRGEDKIHYWHPLYAGYSDRLTLRRTDDRTSTTH